MHIKSPRSTKGKRGKVSKLGHDTITPDRHKDKEKVKERRKAIRTGKQPKEWKEIFITTLRATHSIVDAVEESGISRRYAYMQKTADPEFRAAWEDAWEQGIDELEDEARRRAMEKSDLLMMFLLKGNRPERYTDRVKHSGDENAPMAFSFKLDTRSSDTEDDDGDEGDE